MEAQNKNGRNTMTAIGPTQRKHAIRAQIRSLAFTKGPHDKLPTRNELSQLFGVSTATMNIVLDDLEAQNIIYRRQGSGIFVSPKLHRKNICVLINAIHVEQENVSPFWGILWGKLVKEGHRRATFKNEDVGYRLLAGSANGQQTLPEDLDHALEAGQLHGVLGIGMSRMFDELMVRRNIPMVTYAGRGYWHVQATDEDVIPEAVNRLAAKGCRRIGFWGHTEVEAVIGKDEIRRDKMRVEHIRSAIEKNGLEFHPELFRFGTFSLIELPDDLYAEKRRGDAKSYQDQGYQAAFRTFSAPRSEWPDGLVISDDMITSGALRAFEKLGIRLGCDIMVASHSNAGSPLLHGWDQDMILWVMDPEAIVRALFDTLDILIAGGHPESRVTLVRQHFRD
jgi:DNA-binding LacI/PurR family transcriptional regulator